MKDTDLKPVLQTAVDGFAAAIRVHYATDTTPPPRVRLMLVCVVGDDVGEGYCVGAKGLTDADALVMLGEAMGEIIARDPNAAKLLARLQAEPEHLAAAIAELTTNLPKKDPTP